MKTWNTAGAGRFTLTRSTDERTAGIRVTFVRGDTFLGEAAPVTDVTTGYIRDADVAIASNITADPLTQRVIIYLTALHELGHALGLPHSAEFADIMYLFREPDDAERYFGAYRRKLRSEKDIGSVKATGLSPHDLQVFDAVYSG